MRGGGGVIVNYQPKKLSPRWHYYNGMAIDTLKWPNTAALLRLWSRGWHF